MGGKNGDGDVVRREAEQIYLCVILQDLVSDEIATIC